MTTEFVIITPQLLTKVMKSATQTLYKIMNSHYIQWAEVANDAFFVNIIVFDKGARIRLRFERRRQGELVLLLRKVLIFIIRMNDVPGRKLLVLVIRMDDVPGRELFVFVIR